MTLRGACAPTGCQMEMALGPEAQVEDGDAQSNGDKVIVDSLERMIGTAVVIAYLEVTKTVKEAQLAAQVKWLKRVKWEMRGQKFQWYLRMFRVMMKTGRGWFYLSPLWNLIFLQRRDGSFALSQTLATVLCAGTVDDLSALVTNNPTGDTPPLLLSPQTRNSSESRPVGLLRSHHFSFAFLEVTMGVIW
ncbi:hypothetical protein CYMTET_19480 [Cymbomonas tetramitiformis]|uniref:Uncharacterized protein n=1 Tax=Cymbomonas tetramitiformis TaxID=36881 RepID=A0AAE0L590_9CHLO|nr:hypothetical protein CYMTET_19480 [Cymbomonas tetramitiformis]